MPMDHIWNQPVQLCLLFSMRKVLLSCKCSVFYDRCRIPHVHIFKSERRMCSRMDILPKCVHVCGQERDIWRKGSKGQCLHIKYSMFGKCMNECMSGPSLALACRVCRHLSMFFFCFFLNSFCDIKFPEVRKEKAAFIVQICLSCEVATQDTYAHTCFS